MKWNKFQFYLGNYDDDDDDDDDNDEENIWLKNKNNFHSFIHEMRMRMNEIKYERRKINIMIRKEDY